MTSSGRPYKSEPKIEELAFVIERNENEKVKKTLAEFGIDATDSFLRTSLIWAAFYDNLELANWLIENGTDINHQDRNGLTPLHFAVKENRIEIIKLLIEKKVKIEVKDENGNTPLMEAIFNSANNFDICELLIENGADIENENFHEMTPKLLAESMYDEIELKKIKNW